MGLSLEKLLLDQKKCTRSGESFLYNTSVNTVDGTFLFCSVLFWYWGSVGGGGIGKNHVLLDNMDPLGGNILYWDVIRSGAPILDSDTFAWLLLWTNNNYFEPFWLGAASKAMGTFGVWSDGCGPYPQFCSYLSLKIGDGHDTMIVWGQPDSWFLLHCLCLRHRWAWISRFFEV